ncbi:hypothetical protein DVDV_3284 [Desulfovibrio sp. DV]|uniref:SGNH/GDSL hydrolase family protein n=1 Tax=Desulfovibrio sp. DV TaxID=1844708 RepID=UPI00094B7A70|nr:SGNH/GDSL hydrolase family protein [Desulfovibrio sp. DV]OLN25541.1 hypothetical protein DVDV_3284 [Desulfovibrio sp. DV]
MKTDKVILLLLLGCLVSMSGIALYYKLGWDRMDKQMREISTDVDTVNTAIKDLSGLYARTRSGIILAQLRSQDLPLIVMFGDSIVEQMYCPAIDGINVINTAISGSKALESKAFLDSILAASRGPLVTLSMGTNDAFGEKVATPEQFATGYEALVRTVLDNGRRLVLVTLPPLEREKAEARLFNGVSIEAYNTAIRTIGQRHKLVVADVNAVLTARRTAQPGSHTVDGVHLDAASAAVWRDTVYAAIHQALAQP